MKIAILDDYQNCATSVSDWSVLPDYANLTVFSEHEPDQDKLIQRLKPYDVLCIMRERTLFPSYVLERLPQLKLLVTSGNRNAAIDLSAATKFGIIVCGTSGEIGGTTEMIWALIMAVMRDIVTNDQIARSGFWQSGSRLGKDLKGATIRFGTWSAGVPYRLHC